MKLSDKGLFRPPPKMAGLLRLVADEIQTWPNVTAATHWNLNQRDVADGADFYLGEEEIGHLHFYGEAHVASDKKMNATFIQLGKAQPFRYRFDPTYQHWTQVTIETHEKAQNAIELFRANYERLRGKKTPVHPKVT
nr:luciferase family protein [Rhodoferax sp.]